MKKIIIIGAGLAGLSAAKEAAERGTGSILVSDQPSERAQSVLAQGGINAASYMEEGDSVQSHYEDTLAGGAYLADPEALRVLTAAAPQIVEELAGLGVPFHREDGKIARRGLGGQKKKRAAYAQKSTGKMLVTALADEVRKYEASGLVERMAHHKFAGLYLKAGECRGCFVRDTYTGDAVFLEGPVPEDKEADVLEASRCMQCGCCLEICTSFVPGEAFAGPSAMVSMARLLENLPENQEERTKTAYRKFFYEGCEKYNACHHVCPAGIDIARLMAHSDAAVTAAEMNDKKVSNAE